MRKSLKFGNVLVCEYVAKGSNNKHTLVNVFSGDIIVSDFPARLQLGLYIEYLPTEDKSDDLIIELKINRKNLAKLGVSARIATDDGPSTIILPSIQIELNTACTFNIYAYSESHRKTKILSKKIYKKNPLSK